MAHLSPDLRLYGAKTYSQTNEDGIIAHIVGALGIERGRFVEFGVGPSLSPGASDGLEANCRLLAEQGWTGLWMDGGTHSLRFGVRQEFVTALNINGLLAKYGFADDLDLMSIDIDGQDLWVWLSLTAQPRIVVIEYNATFLIGDSRTVPFQTDFAWDFTQYCGASLTALWKVGRSKGYTLVYANGVNAFFVRDELFDNPGDFPLERVHFNWTHPPGPHLDRPWTLI